jgi:PIN domain nuclease of toxin-antitoxin system
MASKVVLDTSAVLALLFGEPGAEVATDRGSDGLLSTVSYSETMAKSIDRGVPLEIVRQVLAGLRLTLVPFDREHAVVAATFRPITRHLNGSFADRACLATAKLAGLPALSAERKWNSKDLGVEIIPIR